MDHLANQRHSREEVTKAVQKLKTRPQQSRLTTADKAFISEMFDSDSSKSGITSEADLAGNDSSSSELDDEEESEIAYVATEDLLKVEQQLGNAAFAHGLYIHSPRITTCCHAYISSQSHQQRFNGIRIDTCCNRTSIMGQQQYHNYCSIFGIQPSIKPCKGRKINGIAGGIRGTGLVLIDIPFTALNLVVPIEFLLVAQNIPTLLSLRDMKLNGLDISLQQETITYAGRSQKLTLENYFLKHNWTPDDLPFALYTEVELRKIHRTFGHPSVSATQNLLKRAKGSNLSTETRSSIEQIARDCGICQKYEKAPRRFKLTVGMSGLRFNHSVQVDTLFLEGHPVCHMIDEATHFTAASFLRSQSTADVWKAIQENWCLIYLGPPDHIRVDQGTNYMSREMHEKCEADGITLQQAPIETPGSMGIVERYHAPLRAAYTKIRAEMSHATSREECLKMAVFAVNNTVGPEGLCPTLLVFGTLPRPIRATPSATQIARARAIDNAMTSVEQVQARRRIQFGLRHGGGPKGKEDKNNLKKLPAGSKVLVYRTTTDMWEGPYLFVSEADETAAVQTGAGRRLFRSVCVKPYTRPGPDGETWEGERQEGHIAMHAEYDSEKEKDPRTPRGRKPGFEETRRQEISGLINNGTFEPTKISQIPPGTRIFGSRFIDQLKVICRRQKCKSRLVAQNYLDDGATELSTKAPTIQRFAQRMLMSMSASLHKSEMCARDVTQAYFQSRTKLERPVYLRPPREMGLPDDVVLKVVKPLYGIPESGLHWYLTYLEHHVARLGMCQSRVDPCFLLKHDRDGALMGAAILQVDDTLMTGTKEFFDDEQDAAAEFKSKKRVELSKNGIAFNGIQLEGRSNGTISCRVTDKIIKLKTAKDDKDFASIRAAAQYIGVTCRPEICANTQLIAPGNEPIRTDEYKTLADILAHLKETKDRGLDFVPIDLDTARIVIISDASFANARGCKSQLGFLVLMIDAGGRANIIHYGSTRCRRVTRSVMAAELHALVTAFDFGFVVRELMQELLKKEIVLEALVYSKTVFDFVAKDANTTERRLQIDIYSLKESYARGELSRLGWIPGGLNTADALTKKTALRRSRKATNLAKLMADNRFDVSPVGWAEMRASEEESS